MTAVSHTVALHGSIEYYTHPFVVPLTHTDLCEAGFMSAHENRNLAQVRKKKPLVRHQITKTPGAALRAALQQYKYRAHYIMCVNQ